MTVYAKSAGTWADVGCGQARHLGVWKDVKEVWVRHEGEWERVCKRPVSYAYSGTLTVATRIVIDKYYYYGFMPQGATYGAAFTPVPSGSPKLYLLYWNEETGNKRYLYCNFSPAFEDAGTVVVKIGSRTFTVPHYAAANQYRLELTQTQFEQLPTSGNVSITVTYNS